MKKSIISLAMLLLWGSMAFAQYGFEYIFDSINNKTQCCLFNDIIELDNGDFILEGVEITLSGEKSLYRFSQTGELLNEKIFYDEQNIPGYDDYSSANSPLLVDKNGGFYLFFAYNPIFDTLNANYVPNTFDAKIVMKKLDNDFEIEYSREIPICIDTADWENLWGQHNIGSQPPRISIGTVLDDDNEGFIVSYEKYIGEAFQHHHIWENSNDSTFFFKTDYDLNVKKSGFYEHKRCIGSTCHKNHLLHDRDEHKYLYYTGCDWSYGDPELKGFYVHQFDENFSFIEEHMLPKTDGTGFNTYFIKDDHVINEGITLKRTSAHTTIIGAGVIPHSTPLQKINTAACLEISDNAKLVDSMNFAGRVPSSSHNSTSVPMGRCIDWVDEDRIFIGGTPDADSHIFSFSPQHQYFILCRLDREFNIIDELYYDMGRDSSALHINALRATADGGCIIAGHFRKFSQGPNGYGYGIKYYHSVVKKFPPEAFNGIEEAHDNGVKVAVAYPNPGQNTLNVRTALANAYIEVYDINGKLIHCQAITDLITTISADCWPSGVYIWKVYSNGKEAECGKWVK